MHDHFLSSGFYLNTVSSKCPEGSIYRISGKNICSLVRYGFIYIVLFPMGHLGHSYVGSASTLPDYYGRFEEVYVSAHSLCRNGLEAVFRSEQTFLTEIFLQRNFMAIATVHSVYISGTQLVLIAT